MIEPLKDYTAIILPKAIISSEGEGLEATLHISDSHVDFVLEDTIYFRLSKPEIAAILAIMQNGIMSEKDNIKKQKGG